MGCCFTCEVQDDCSYTILLKMPHDTTCHRIDTSGGNAWEYCDNINSQIKDLYKVTMTTWIVYNDETPDKTVSHGAHAKGILAWNDIIVTWLIHSVPKFPVAFHGTNDFPDIHSSELMYSQSFIHLTFPIRHLQQLLTQLFVMNPTVYITNYDCKSYAHIHKEKGSSLYKISRTLHHVAKSPENHKEFYEDVLIPEFGGHCYTETWVRGHACIETKDCTMAKKITWNDTTDYTYTHDHSKYCYSDNGWVMIGDLNRMTSQCKRGGGGIVIRDKLVCNAFRKIML